MKRARQNRDNDLILFIKQRWPWGCLLFFCIACRNTSTGISQEKTAANRQQVDSTALLLKSGDLVFRNGTDEMSRAARSFNRIDTSFSHCGIVLVENDTPFVYHALGGNYNPGQKLRRDPIGKFCSAEETDRFAIYRYNLIQQQTDSLTAIVHQHYHAGLPFDMYFNFLSDDKMYCSEFVFKCLNRSLSDSLSLSIKAREWPFGVSPDDLFLNPRSRLIKRVDFTR